jgi:hypothetical protein
VIIDDKKKNIATRILVFTFGMILLLLGALLAAILIKLGNQNLSLSTININSAFNSFLLTVANEVSVMKSINYDVFTGNTYLAGILFNVAAGGVNITTAMDNLVVNFNINSITQTWSTLTCNTTSGGFILGSENNFLTVSDFVQNPVTNLVASNLSAFKFPPFLSGQALPLSSTSCLFFELVLNAIYITIPGFLALKTSVIDSLLLGNVGVSLPMVFVFLAVLLISGLYVVGKVLLNFRVSRLKNTTYDIFESLPRELVQEKEKNCRDFIAKYTLIDNDGAEDAQLLSDHSGTFKTDADFNMSSKVSRNMDKTVEEETQR